jgi:hypothetical protein
MHHQFNIQQLYALPTLYLCVLYLSENKQRLVPLKHKLTGFYNLVEKCLLRSMSWGSKYNSLRFIIKGLSTVHKIFFFPVDFQLPGLMPSKICASGGSGIGSSSGTNSSVVTHVVLAPSDTQVTLPHPLTPR